ncbi:MAG: ABC transporter substrate-binding protein [Dehalococcoidales bacterium]|nr:ABC transporter substrate-binding protein [Dehalococcoidales bacterium]
MYKVFLGVFLVVMLLAASLFTACGDQTTAPSAAPATTQAAPPAATQAATQAASQTQPPAQKPASGQPKYGGKMVYMANNSPAGNIGWPAATFTMVPQYYLYDSLVKAWWDGTVTPSLASSWDIDTNEPSITFHLRNDVKFHDGSPFNAQAVKFNFDAMIEAKKRADWKSVEIIDDYTVKIKLATWRSTILPVFDGNCFVSQAAVEKNGIDWAKLNPVGTGPFRFVEFVPDDHMTLERNPDYWNEGLPYLDEVEIIYVPDLVTRKAAMQKGEVDITMVALGKETADYAEIDGVEMFAQPQATTFIIFDDLNEDSPFYDKKVREAVDHAIDREWLAENLGYGYLEPCYQLPTRISTSYDPSYVGREYNPEKSKQLLAEAGYPDGFSTELLPNPTFLNKDIWVSLQAQLTKAGIKTDLKFLEAARYNEYRNTGTWKNAIIGDTLPAYGNMNQSFVQDFAPGAEFFLSMNKARPDWVEAITASSTSTEYDAGLTMKAARVLYDNVSVVPVIECGQCFVYRSYVKGGRLGDRNAYFWAYEWENVWLDK